MTPTRLLLRNLLYHWRGNLAVLLGTLVGTAVLTGALLVGDSLQGSLRERSLGQLGWIDAAVVSNRFFGKHASDGLPGNHSTALLLQGAVRTQENDPTQVRRAGKVTVLGIERTFWTGRAEEEPVWESDQEVAYLSSALANELRIRVGDVLWLSLEKASELPRSSLLGRRRVDESVRELKLTVAEIFPENHFGSRFSLLPNAVEPRNLFVPHPVLRRAIDRQESGGYNACFVGGAPLDEVERHFHQQLTLEDWGIRLKVRGPESAKYLSVEAERLVLEPYLSETILETARAAQLEAAPTLVYLIDSITRESSRKPEIPYSIVAALDPQRAAPLGPMLPPNVRDLGPEDIALLDWPEAPFRVAVGERVRLTYFEPEIEGKIRTTEKLFTMRGYVPLKPPAADRDLTPPFPGVTDKLHISDWDPPFPYDSRRVQRRDENFWDEYRTTPKAFVRLETGQKLWGTKFGSVTSIRLAAANGDSQSLDAIRSDLAQRLRQNLDPLRGGFGFDRVRERLLAASKGGTDFGMLFVSFSFFLIAAALLLVGLLFRLNIDRRAGEIGMLLAVGWPKQSVRRLLLLEGLVLAASGGLLGIAGSIGYADAMIHLFSTQWPTQAVSFLTLHVSPLSLLIGFGSAVLMCGLTILWSLRIVSRMSPSILIVSGSTAMENDPGNLRTPRTRWPLLGAVFCWIGAFGLAWFGRNAPVGEAQAGAFFGCGAFLLIALLSLTWSWMRAERRGGVRGHGPFALLRLGTRNATRSPTRSLLTIALLASAAFLLVAVESFRREPAQDFALPSGGSGGFALLAEASVPFFQDLDSEPAREELSDELRLAYQAAGYAPNAIEQPIAAAEKMLQTTKIFSLRLRGGDDASCLNLYQANKPRLLSVPDTLIERGGFQFADTLATTDEERANPWRLLQRPCAAEEPIPVFVEKNSAQWMLKRGLGDVLEPPDFALFDEMGRPLRLKIVGLLQDSVFQSEIVLSDTHFRKAFPRQEDFNFFLIEAAPGTETEVSNLLTLALRRNGVTVSPSRDRVAAYLEVQNTYLTTFQLLGGFGLLLGVLGLSVVLLRNVWERRGELALLRALGYGKRTLNGLMLAENALLLLLGILTGVLAAFGSVAPQLLGGGDVPWLRLATLLGATILVGLTVAAIAVISTLRAPLIPALRKE